MLASGTIVDNRYQILRHLGDGGMGTVYKARESGLERIVALKILHETLLRDSESRARFRQEGTILSSVAHPNVLTLYRFGIADGGLPYIAMEFLEGESLRDLLNREGSLLPSKCVEIARVITSAMEAVHAAGIVHRDLKPTNVFLASDPEPEFVKILDFGVARLIVNEPSQHLTHTGALVGSVHYMSPEQCRGVAADERSDIYSLGCVLYEMLSGRLPLEADNPIGLMHKHLWETPAPLELANGQPVPAGLSAVIFKALEKDVRDRYQSMTELEADLNLVSCGRGGEISPAHPQDNRRPQKISPLLLLGTVLICCTVVSVFLGSSRKSKTIEFSSHSSVAVPHKLYEPGEVANRYSALPDRVAYYERWLNRSGGARKKDVADAHYYLADVLKSVGGSHAETDLHCCTATQQYLAILQQKDADYSPDEMITIYGRLGLLANEKGQGADAPGFFTKGLAAFQKSASPFAVSETMREFCEVLFTRERYALAEQWLQRYVESLSKCRSDETREVLAARLLMARLKLAQCQLELGRNDESKKSLDAALLLVDASTGFESEWGHLLVKVMRRQHRSQECATLLHNMDRRLVRFESRPQIWLKKGLAEVNVDLGRFAESAENYQIVMKYGADTRGWESLTMIARVKKLQPKDFNLASAILLQIKRSEEQGRPAGEIVDVLLSGAAALKDSEEAYQREYLGSLFDYANTLTGRDLDLVLDRCLVAMRELQNRHCSSMLLAKIPRLQKRAEGSTGVPLLFSIRSRLILANALAIESRFRQAHLVLAEAKAIINQHLDARQFQLELQIELAETYRLEGNFNEARAITMKVLHSGDSQPHVRTGWRWLALRELQKICKSEHKLEEANLWRNEFKKCNPPVDW